MQHQKFGNLYRQENEHWWYKARRDIVSHLFWDTNHPIAKNPSILSVGASSGAEIDYLSHFGTVTGLELDDELVAFNQKRGLNVLKMDIRDCSLPDNSFDVVFAMDVLEHVQDDYGAYKQVMRVVKPGGCAVITVPACMFLWSEFDEGYQGHFPHFRRYNRSNFKKLLSSQNVAIRKLSYYNFFLFPAVALTRKLKLAGPKQMKVPGKWMNGFFKGIFAFEKHFLRWAQFPIGVSLIAIVEKKK